jgi:poly(3-hydroxybutyrate) depolymerase
MIDAGGKSRMYVLDVPENYDPNTPYRLVFVWHPLGGSASQVVGGGYNGLKSISDGTAVFVAPDGQDGANEMVSGRGWWNAGNEDMEFFTAMLDEFNGGLCIDQERIFSTGFSFGGMMSYTVGYHFDVFRAIAPCSGNLTVIDHDENNTGPLAIMAFHGDNDTFVTTSGGFDALTQYVGRNGCDSGTEPVSPSPCVSYQGCDVPTIWCEFPGGHEPWSQQPQAIWDFFSQF